MDPKFAWINDQKASKILSVAMEIDVTKANTSLRDKDWMADISQDIHKLR